MPVNAKYPWAEWFSRKSILLTQGTHFDISRQMMSQSIRNRARMEGLYVSIMPQGADSLLVIIRKRPTVARRIHQCLPL